LPGSFRFDDSLLPADPIFDPLQAADRRGDRPPVDAAPPSMFSARGLSINGAALILNS
jgi:hypothetical protein